MIERLPKFENKVTLVSPLEYPAFLIDKHVRAGALFVMHIEDPVLFGAGKEWYIAKLLEMQRYLTVPAQCILLYNEVDRLVLFDTLYFWHAFGGVSLPIVHDEFQTLVELEKNLKAGLLPQGLQND